MRISQLPARDPQTIVALKDVLGLTQLDTFTAQVIEQGNLLQGQIDGLQDDLVNVSTQVAAAEASATLAQSYAAQAESAGDGQMTGHLAAPDPHPQYLIYGDAIDGGNF